MHRLLLLAGALSTMGCIEISKWAGNDDRAGSSLGIVQVGYVATSDSDVVGIRQAPGAVAAGVHIAAGSSFGLVPIDLRDAQAPVTLVAADPALLTITSDGSSIAPLAGKAGVLVKDSQGNAVDFAELDVRSVARAAIETDVSGPRAVGDGIVLAARTFDANGVALAGTLAADWKSSDPSILALAPTSTEPGSRVRATAVAPGHVQVSVDIGKQSASVEIEVRP
jgi:hypothetical protein